MSRDSSDAGTDHCAGGVDQYPAGLDLLHRDARVEAAAEIWRMAKGQDVETMQAVESVLRQTYGDDVVADAFKKESVDQQSLRTDTDRNGGN